ncbi:tetraacyldisaccharide 4'-kinase [Gaetbulibacter sp. M235]|uniref:tetraacyldisaccharide 4'-kinase n=1 Tax=Gaetbulibacter sp. M235 TaxID=3126510 RepID=UPI00374E2B27
MKFYRKLFFPFVPVYYSVTWLRNKLYDLGIKKSVSFDFPVICVGNLSVGGTGKTPMIEYLIELLKEDYSIATLSRGYKRKTKGFQLADLTATSETIGDEPFQFFSKFKDKIQVAVDSDRVNGINRLKSLKKSPEVILLDDAFQHRKIKAGLNILLTTYNALFIDDYVLPAGNLRESRNGYKRANIIVITKCPKNLDETEKNTIIKRINPLDYQKVFFSNIEYSSFVKSNVNEKSLVELNEFTLVTGIANAQPLVDFLKSKHLKFEHLNFQDHYDFSESDIDELCKKDLILTTEKDFMRLQSFPSLKDKLFYLPITVSISESDKFNALVKKFVTSKM